MAGSQLQNVQRGTILLWLTSLGLIGTMLTVKLIKKRIDFRRREVEEVEANSAADKYKQNQMSQNKIQISKLQQTAVNDITLNDDDNCVQRMMKKACEFNVNYNPLMLGMVITFASGRSYAFPFSIYIIGIICCILFNVFKIHRACINYWLGRWIIQIIYPACCVIVLVSLIVGDRSGMIYTLRQG